MLQSKYLLEKIYQRPCCGVAEVIGGVSNASIRLHGIRHRTGFEYLRQGHGILLI